MNPHYVSGLRRLEGEDLDHGDRLYKQRMQQKMWLDQQIREKEASKRIQQETNSQWNQYQSDINSALKQAEDEYNARHREMREAARVANEQMIREKLAREALEQEEQSFQNSYEQTYTTTSALMTEDPSTTRSALAEHRKVPYHYKGMSQEELNQIYSEQKRQAEENARKREEEKRQAIEEARMSEAQRRALILYEREMKAKQDRLNAETREHLKTQMLEHKEKYTDPYNEKGKDYLIPL